MSHLEDKEKVVDISFEPSPLPSAKDKLFSNAEDWQNNACLNFLYDNWSLYADGYKDAADILVAYVEEKQRRQDTLIYPIVFLYRQYLELALKNIIRNGRRLQDNSEPFPKTHKIDNLWKICDQLLSEISPGDSVEEMKQIGRLISEFCLVDPTSESFRYPEDKDGNPSLPDLDNINLRNVHEVIDKIHTILYGADAQICEGLSIKAEMTGY